MKIYGINQTQKNFKLNKTSPNVNFKAGLNLKVLKDVFVKNKGQGLKKLVDIYPGAYGTQCRGSIPLNNFFKLFPSRQELENVIKKGLSTDDQGFAYSFLKTSGNNPVSTSFVQDCSVIYLYNKNRNNHFLYHMYSEVDKKELEYMIKTFMKEGYTKASIVPGSNRWSEVHKGYLPMVFDTLKSNNPKAIVNVYHNTSKVPEIVGYKGAMFQIDSNILADWGQATFKISDAYVGNTLTKIHYANSVEVLNKLKKYFDKQKYDIEIKKVLNRLILERQNEIKKIQSFKNLDELYRFLETKTKDYLNGCFEYSHEGYNEVIRNQIIKLGSKS